MARVKKQFLELLSSMKPAEVEKLHARLVGPKLKGLRRERAQLQKKLAAVEQKLAALGVAAPPKRRKKAVRRKKVAVRKARVVVAKRRGRRKGTIADKIATILQKAGKPVRVKDICNALVKAGVPRKKGLVNYVNRTLSINPRFKKAGWGLYTLAGAGAAAPAKKSARKKKVARKKRAAGRKKKAVMKKVARRRRRGRRRKAAPAKPAPAAPPAQ